MLNFNKYQFWLFSKNCGSNSIMIDVKDKLSEILTKCDITVILHKFLSYTPDFEPG